MFLFCFVLFPLLFFFVPRGSSALVKALAMVGCVGGRGGGLGNLCIGVREVVWGHAYCNGMFDGIPLLLMGFMHRTHEWEWFWASQHFLLSSSERVSAKSTSPRGGFLPCFLPLASWLWTCSNHGSSRLRRRWGFPCPSCGADSCIWSAKLCLFTQAGRGWVTEPQKFFLLQIYGPFPAQGLSSFPEQNS